MGRMLEQRVGWRIEDDYPLNQIRLLRQTALSMGHYGLGKIEVIEGQIDSLGNLPEKGRERVIVCGQGLSSLTTFKDIFGSARKIEEDLVRVKTREPDLIKAVNEVIRVQSIKAMLQGEEK